jgi:hypothetical protein
LAYFPSIISVDNWISYRTMGTVTLLSSVLLIATINSFPFKKVFYNNLLISILVVLFVGYAFQNNNTFTGIAVKEFSSVKNVISEKLKNGYPKKVLVIMSDEKFLKHQKIVINTVTDEFGNLSNSVAWGPPYFIAQEVYELTNDKLKAQSIKVSCYTRDKLPADSIIQQHDWILDIEKIYLDQK